MVKQHRKLFISVSVYCFQEWWLRFLDSETYIGSFKYRYWRQVSEGHFSIIIMVVVRFTAEEPWEQMKFLLMPYSDFSESRLEKTVRGGSVNDGKYLTYRKITMQFGGVVALYNLTID